jgi:hypothetical protein
MVRSERIEGSFGGYVTRYLGLLEELKTIVGDREFERAARGVLGASDHLSGLELSQQTTDRLGREMNRSTQVRSARSGATGDQTED